MNHISGGIDDAGFLVNSCSDLFSFDDEDFIVQAYLLFLDRFPDAGGRRYYLSRLRAGYSKTHLLAQINRSTEKGGQSPSLPGLSALLRRHRIASLFGLAWIFRLFGYTEGNSRSERRDRALLSALAGIRAQVEQLRTELRVAETRYPAQPEASATQPAAEPLSEGEAAAPITRQARQKLNLGDQEFALPISMDSRTRQLVAALEREILFAKKAI